MDWPKRAYRWQENGREYISIPFTYNLPEVRQSILEGNLFTGRPVVGGPAVKLMPDYLADIADIGTDIPGVLQRVNPLATRTTVGCVNRCPFCAVPTIEGEFRELQDWPNLPIVCDNNLLAASKPHFDKVVDRLKVHRGVDFNQGLDARLMTQYHADRLAELDAKIRLAWDNTSTERYLLSALTKLRKAGIPRNRIQCYVLIGFNDTPEDALYRLETLKHSLGINPNPMRYTPLCSLERDYVGANWTEAELTRFMRYWANLRHTAGVPFEEFGRKTKEAV